MDIDHCVLFSMCRYRKTTILALGCIRSASSHVCVRGRSRRMPRAAGAQHLVNSILTVHIREKHIGSQLTP